jgi:hypothetical protein
MPQSALTKGKMQQPFLLQNPLGQNALGFCVSKHNECGGFYAIAY